MADHTRDTPRHDAEATRPEQVADLIEVLTECIPSWLERCVTERANMQGIGLVPDDERIRTMVAAAAPQVIADITTLLDTDVDAQTTNPLSILRAAVMWPTQVLRELGVHPITRDEFAERNAPDDVYGLAPAGWDDIDERVRTPGLMWGAWKAAVVLHRRRSEGQR